MYLIHIIYVIEDMDNDGRISQETNTKNSQHSVSQLHLGSLNGMTGLAAKPHRHVSPLS